MMRDDLSITEQAALLSGASEWESRANERAGVPAFVMSDGPHGVRRQLRSGDHLGLGESKPATCFPTAGTVANSWDPVLVERMGRALGREAHDLDVNILLGPGMNIKRNPLCGRNFEYFSEDPIVSGRMAAGLITGVQSQGVGACPKHFAVNSQELRRQSSNSVVDERTMRELYLTAFEIAVREAKPWSVMTSYNRVNGVYAHENAHLLQDILRKEWGFDGMVVSDWGARIPPSPPCVRVVRWRCLLLATLRCESWLPPCMRGRCRRMVWSGVPARLRPRPGVPVAARLTGTVC